VILPVQEQRQTIGVAVNGNHMIKLSSLINEAEVEQGHENDRDMVTGVAEILLMVKDKDNRNEIANNMVNKFNSENVTFDKNEFLKMCGCE
jgi:hypothetical protein